MTSVQDVIAVAFACIRFGLLQHVGRFVASLTIGVALALLCWLAAVRYTRLWNTGFRVTAVHQLLCALAALLTGVVTVTYAALAFLGDYGVARVAVWRQDLDRDGAWQNQTFLKAYDDVRLLGLEDFRDFPRPPQGHRIPFGHPQSIETAASRYATEAVGSFRRRDPWLARALTPETLSPRDSMRADIAAFFRADASGMYPMARGVTLVARLITNDLTDKMPRLVHLARAGLIALFVIAQTLAFGAISYAAYRDLKSFA